MVKKRVIFDKTHPPSVPGTIDTASDDYILDSLSASPFKESLKDTVVPPDQQSNKKVPALTETPHLSEQEIENARKEVLTNEVKKEEQARQTMENIIGKAPRVLFRCSAVFPFDFFPDELSIEETRINIIEREFWATAEIKAVGISEITEVAVSTTILFATLRIGSRTFIDNLVEIRFLRKKDAMKARRIIEGLRILSGQDVDLSALELSELVSKVEEIGAIQKPQE
jgi:hypothetical protein